VGDRSEFPIFRIQCNAKGKARQGGAAFYTFDVCSGTYVLDHVDLLGFRNLIKPTTGVLMGDSPVKRNMS
jgi:hypothetical protein